MSICPPEVRKKKITDVFVDRRKKNVKDNPTEVMVAGKIKIRTGGKEEKKITSQRNMASGCK